MAAIGVFCRQHSAGGGFGGSVRMSETSTAQINGGHVLALEDHVSVRANKGDVAVTGVMWHTIVAQFLPETPDPIKPEIPVTDETWPDPPSALLTDPTFNAIWRAIKTWDINVPAAHGGYCGATGNHVFAIYRALAASGPTSSPAKCSTTVPLNSARNAIFGTMQQTKTWISCARNRCAE